MPKRTTGQRMPIVLAVLAGLSLPIAVLGAPDDADASPKAPPATAAEGDLSADVRALIDQLGSPEFAVRQRATEQLLGQDPLPLAALERLLAGGRLSAEANARLLQVARQSFYKSPRAALGVEFAGATGLSMLRDRVVVGRTFKEFPSHRLLEPGDIIDRAGGVKLRGPNAQLILPAIIVSHDPGQTLPLVVRRGSKVLSLDVPLGNFSDLQNAGGMIAPPDDRISRAWRIRASRILEPGARAGAGGAPAPVNPGVPASEWRSQIADANEAVLLRASVEPSPTVVGGGMPRNAAALEQEQTLIQSLVFINGQQRLIQNPRPRQFVEEVEMVGPRMTQEQELIELARSRTVLREQLRQLGNVDALAPDDPLRARGEAVRKTMEVLDRQSAAIQAEMAEERSGEPPIGPAVDPDNTAIAPADAEPSPKP